MTEGPTKPGRRPRLPSLRVELLLNLGVLATAALLLAVVSATIFPELLASPDGAVHLFGLVAADVAVFVAFGAYLVRRLVVRPLADVVAATRAIAAGDLTRRAPAGATAEFDLLARSINRMTSRLLEEQTHLVRAEKLASVGRLAAGVAHEIGNPLGAINGYTHVLRRHAGSAPQVAEALLAIERESARIDRIVRGMLDYSRPRRRAPADVDVNDCIVRVLSMLRDQRALRDVRVRLALDPAAPRLSGDRHEMDQVLVNLTLNAVDAMQGAGDLTLITCRLPLAALRDEGRRRAGDGEDTTAARGPGLRARAWVNTLGDPEAVLQVVVADSGPGIPAEDTERIFDPFFTTKPPGQGTGLGLAITARIVDSLGGVIWVRPAREGGAAFTMWFPVGRAAERRVPSAERRVPSVERRAPSAEPR